MAVGTLALILYGTACFVCSFAVARFAEDLLESLTRTVDKEPTALRKPGPFESIQAPASARILQFPANVDKASHVEAPLHPTVPERASTGGRADVQASH